MYYFYLGELLLPVAPEKVTTKISGKNKTATLINEGEINLLKVPGLTEYSFEALLPNVEYPFAQYTGIFQPAGYYLDALEQLAQGCKPFRFRILRSYGTVAMDWDTDVKVSLESYSIEESADNGPDYVADIKLKRYTEWGTKTLVIKDGSATENGNRDDGAIKDKGETYTIQTGDTLWGIAQAKMGDGTKYHKLYLANKKVLDDEAKRRGMGSEMGERWIFTGTKITIPK